MRPLQNVIKIVITSSRRRPGSSDFKAFLDSGSSPELRKKELFKGLPLFENMVIIQCLKKLFSPKL